LDVFVFLQEIFHGVGDGAGIVLDAKFNGPKTLVSSLHKVGVFAEFMMKFIKKGLICGLQQTWKANNQ